MSKPIKITIGIPTYNQAALLEESLRSVVNQDYSNLEIIILDDASSDNTAEIANRFVNDYQNVKYFRNVNNIGRVATYKKLLFELATGEWYLNLDGDDVLVSPKAISVLHNVISQNAQVQLVMGKAIVFSNEVPIINQDFQEKNDITTFEGKDYFLHQSYHLPFNHAASLYNRNLALELNFYNENCLNTDFVSIIKLCFKGKVATINFPISGWRVHEENATNNVTNAKKSAEIIAYQALADYSKSFVSNNESDNWLSNILENSEKYRLRYLLQKEGLIEAFFSNFDKNKRLTNKLKIKNIMRLFYYFIKENFLPKPIKV